MPLFSRHDWKEATVVSVAKAGGIHKLRLVAFSWVQYILILRLIWKVPLESPINQKIQNKFPQDSPNHS